MQTQRTKRSFGAVQVGIVILGLATALIHFSLMLIMGQFSLLFTLNGLGYLSLLAALFLPIPIFRKYRPIIRMIFLFYTLLTIFLWVLVGSREMIGYVDKVIEVVLAVLLWLDRSRD